LGGVVSFAIQDLFMVHLTMGSAMSGLRDLGGVGAVLAAGAGAVSWGACSPYSQLFGYTIRRTGSPHTVALTFDDGPNPALTPRLLGLLDEHHVRATFFLIGRFASECPELVQEIAARRPAGPLAGGHAIGNHTHTHPSLFWMTPSKIAGELARCQDAIEKACGLRPVWMRPPFGFRGPQLASVVGRAGFHGVVMWSRLAHDWKPQPIEDMISRLRRVRGGEIVLLHDGDHRRLQGDRQQTLAGLDYWLPMWNNAGLKFVTIDDMAGIPPAEALAKAGHAPAGLLS
jgi:peptidoglycan/xylan/chitin deacetylase (PgdA/CDA1 family)